MTGLIRDSSLFARNYIHCTDVFESYSKKSSLLMAFGFSTNGKLFVL